MGTLKSSAVTTAADQKDVSTAVGALVLNDVKLSGTFGVAVVDADYAKSQSLKVGSKITVAGKSFTVVGIVQAAQGVTDADAYIPLGRAQSLASMSGEVNTIYVSAASASDIAAVSAEISKAMPSATVTTSSDLASEVTGSLSSAAAIVQALNGQDIGRLRESQLTRVRAASIGFIFQTFNLIPPCSRNCGGNAA